MRYIFPATFCLLVSAILIGTATVGLAASQENPRVEIERPDDWMIIAFLAALIIGIFLLRRMSAKQKNLRLMGHYLRNPEAPVHEPDFYKLMSYLAGRPQKYKNIAAIYERWQNFSNNYPDKMYGKYAASLMAATSAIQGLKEEKLSQEEALKLLQTSHDSSRNILKLQRDQSSFIKIVIAHGYMLLIALSTSEEQAKPFFDKARWNLIAALDGDLKIFQMIGVLESLAGLLQEIASKSSDPVGYYQQALDYLEMALALNPTSRTVFPALNTLCTTWAEKENNLTVKEKIQKIAGQSRVGRYVQEPFDKDMWLLRLAVIMNNEKTARVKISEMLDVQEEKLFAAMSRDPYLQRFREKSWFKDLMDKARQFQRQPIAD